MSGAAPTDTALRIAGGRVIDPAHGPPRVRDVLIHGGRIVDALPRDASVRTIDATGQLVLAGAIDMHSHVVSRGVAVARELAPDLVPEPRDTARRYLRMGYTTVIDAAVPPADAAVARATAARMKPLDVRYLLDLGTHDLLVETLARHGDAAALDLLAALLRDSGAMGLKLVNPGHVASLDHPINGTPITPRRLMRFAAAAARTLGLSHPLHLHAPDLGMPDSVASTIAALEALQGERVHLAHAQFYAYRSDERGRLASGAQALADFLAAHPHVTIDSGCVLPGPAVMISRDHPLGERLSALTGGALTQRDDWSVMPLIYDTQQTAAAVQWAVGLELILRSTDLTRVALSVDHPNGGPFWRMPELMRLLTSRDARRAALAAMHPAARKRTGLAHIDRELSDDDLATLTRLAPARTLGLPDRGHLGVGAVADVVVTKAIDGEPGVVVREGGISNF